MSKLMDSVTEELVGHVQALLRSDSGQAYAECAATAVGVLRACLRKEHQQVLADGLAGPGFDSERLVACWQVLDILREADVKLRELCSSSVEKLPPIEDELLDDWMNAIASSRERQRP